MSGGRPLLAGAVLLLLAGPALAALQVSVEPERVPPVTLGGAQVWNAYVTVTALRDGRPAAGAAVELRGPSGTLARGDADAKGVVVLPVVSREPVTAEVYVDGEPAGRRVELAVQAATPQSPGKTTQPSPSAGGGVSIPLAQIAAAAALAGCALFLGLKRFKRKRGG